VRGSLVPSGAPGGITDPLQESEEVWSCDTSFAVSYTILLSMVVRPSILNMYFGQPGSIVEVLKEIAGEDHMRRSRRVRAFISV
jgi:hypothetical protein